MARAISAELRAEILRDQEDMGSGGVHFYKITTVDGEQHRMRVLPGKYGSSGERWYVASKQHWANKHPYECTGVTDPDEDEACPFCVALTGLRKQEGSLKDRVKRVGSDQKAHKRAERQLAKLVEMIKQMVAKPQYLVNITLPKSNTPNQSFVYRPPKSVFDDMLNAFGSEDEDIFDPHEGNDFRVSRTTKNQRTSYKTALVPNKTALADTDEEIEEILSSAANLEELLSTPDLKAMKKAVRELLTDVEDALDDPSAANEQEKHVSRKATFTDDEDQPPKKKKPVVEDPDDDDPPPKKKKPVVEDPDDDDPPPKKKKPVVEDPDDDDPPPKKKKPVVEDPDDDDPPPKKKKPVVDGEEQQEESQLLHKKLTGIIDLGDDD